MDKRESTMYLKGKWSRWFYWMCWCSQRKADLCKDINVRWPSNDSGEHGWQRKTTTSLAARSNELPWKPIDCLPTKNVSQRWRSEDSKRKKKKRSPLFSSSSSVLHSSVKHSSCLSVLCSEAPKEPTTHFNGRQIKANGTRHMGQGKRALQRHRLGLHFYRSPVNREE